MVLTKYLYYKHLAMARHALVSKEKEQEILVKSNERVLEGYPIDDSVQPMTN